MILFPPWRPFLSSALLSKPSLTSDRAIESRVRIASSLRVSNLFFARVEIPSVRGVSSYRVERNPVRQERKCKSGLGVREGRAKPLRAPGRNQELRWNGGMKSIDARESVYVSAFYMRPRPCASVGPSMQMQLSSGVGCFVAR